jgi:peptidoglycan hydrolase-like protein with peptidoglycan-binding domain
MRVQFITASALAALLAVAPAALAQSGAQTGAMGSGGSTSNPTAAPNGPTTGNAPASMQTPPSEAVAPGAAYSHGAGSGAMSSGSASHVNSGGDDQGQQLSQDEIQNIQQHLQQQGYYKSARVDGRWGPRTRQAVESFQQAKGLPANGQLDQQTLNALGVNQGG